MGEEEKKKQRWIDYFFPREIFDHVNTQRKFCSRKMKNHFAMTIEFVYVIFFLLKCCLRYASIGLHLTFSHSLPTTISRN